MKEKHLNWFPNFEVFFALYQGCGECGYLMEAAALVDERISKLPH